VTGHACVVARSAEERFEVLADVLGGLVAAGRRTLDRGGTP
jgi:hypothetical protein